jgi:hypothetical protein
LPRASPVHAVEAGEDTGMTHHTSVREDTMTSNSEVPTTVNIAGLSLADVLAALYNSARKRGALTDWLGLPHYDRAGTVSMTPDDATGILQKATAPVRIVDVENRRLDVDLSRDEFDPSPYDSFNGTGRARLVIDMLRRHGHGHVASLG